MSPIVKTLSSAAVGAALLGLTSLALAEESKAVINVPKKGSVTKAQGLEAWARIYEVASHPRCANCHTGASDRPMWSGPSYGQTRPHGMNIRAGTSRIGAETVLCGTCHVNSEATGRGNPIPHEAPRVAMAWRLAPAEAHWFGRTSQQICAQLRDPKQNGNRSFEDIASHLGHDLILHWAWNPGGGREPAPYDLQRHVNDILAWGVAGMPCPDDG